MGLIACAVPGIQPNKTNPSPINSAEAAGSRPEKNLGSQYARMIAAPRHASTRW